MSRSTQPDSFRSGYDVWSLACVSLAVLWVVVGDMGSKTVGRARDSLNAIARKLARFQGTLDSFMADPESSLGCSNSLDCDEPLFEDPDIVMSDYEPGCSSTPVVISPSPSGSWSLPSLESVGITSEEWVTRGWDVFFGAWG